MGTKVRVLVDTYVDGVSYAPNQVVDFPAQQAQALAKSGNVDPAKDAVDYCVQELGVAVIVHQPVATS